MVFQKIVGVICTVVDGGSLQIAASCFSCILWICFFLLLKKLYPTCYFNCHVHSTCRFALFLCWIKPCSYEMLCPQLGVKYCNEHIFYVSASISQKPQNVEQQPVADIHTLSWFPF